MRTFIVGRRGKPYARAVYANYLPAEGTFAGPSVSGTNRGAETVADASGCDNAAVTLGGNLSAFARSKLTCQTASSEVDALNAGMPVKRMPLATFQ